jgi:hypothetical protein
MVTRPSAALAPPGKRRASSSPVRRTAASRVATLPGSGASACGPGPFRAVPNFANRCGVGPFRAVPTSPTRQPHVESAPSGRTALPRRPISLAERSSASSALRSHATRRSHQLPAPQSGSETALFSPPWRGDGPPACGVGPFRAVPGPPTNVVPAPFSAVPTSPAPVWIRPFTSGPLRLRQRHMWSRLFQGRSRPANQCGARPCRAATTVPPSTARLIRPDPQSWTPVRVPARPGGTPDGVRISRRPEGR